MKLATITLFALSFLFKDFSLAWSKRAILNDFEWLSEADLSEKLPISEKVMESPQSFFHLGDNGDLSDLSETLEIELDHAMNRKWNEDDNEGAKSKREAVPYIPEVEREVFSLMPEASAVKEMETERSCSCNNVQADQRPSLEQNQDKFGQVWTSLDESVPMRVQDESLRKDAKDEFTIVKPIPLKVVAEHQKENKHNFIPRKIRKNLLM